MGGLLGAEGYVGLPLKLLGGTCPRLISYLIRHQSCPVSVSHTKFQRLLKLFDRCLSHTLKIRITTNMKISAVQYLLTGKKTLETSDSECARGVIS